MDYVFPKWSPASLPWLEFNLSTVAMILITCVITYALCMWFIRGLSVNNPSKKQVIFETIYEFIRGVVASTMDMKRGERFVALAMTLFLFIFIANFLGIPLKVTASFTETTPFWESLGITKEVIEAQGGSAYVLFWTSPTSSASVTIAMAIAIVLLSHVLGVQYRGPAKHAKHFFQPNPLFFPLHIIEEGAKMLTLGFRLYGNIYAKEVLIAVILTMPLMYYYVGGFATMVIWQGFGIFMGTVQAFVFTVLSMVYISTQTADHH
ncbi:F0F1 ATP synthase subunit A [Desulfuribacillus alkaliarsenatis]|uniref:ATP synthase subunit a n=1 Tax=Desulfuribacillus alkaliarsenatis TaxID=766136 RepID=A0A1E5G1K3_9FIRM|nr:F0F1 ATP synthase subunit A [Desulfuribacillus alkaliarsenatis]OEF96775.1 ATP synthase F0 subunit A [Desulfuribacillus alkaliarsenatis]